jgi:hypothetical protein
MSQEIPTSFVRQYTDGIRILQQQMGSRLMNAVMTDFEAEGDRSFYDQLESTSMQEVTNRHGDTEYTDTPHRRRMVTRRTYEVADLVDRADVRRLLNNPINAYTRNMAAAANRRLDLIVLNAFFANASTGVDGEDSTAFPTAGFEVDNASNLTHVELLEAREILEAAENEEDTSDDDWFIACSASNRKSLLEQAEVQSIDTNTVRALVQGQIDEYLGFGFLKTQHAPKTGNDRSIPVWVKRSMMLSVSQDPQGFMDTLPQKRHSTQVRYEMDAGSTRMDEKGVVRIIADET